MNPQTTPADLDADPRRHVIQVLELNYIYNHRILKSLYRELYKIKINEYTNIGYDVSSLKEIANLDKDTIENVLFMLDNYINRHEQLEDEFLALDITGFEQEAAAFKEYLLDLQKIDDAEIEFQTLREKIFEKRTEDYKRTIAKKKNADELAEKYRTKLEEDWQFAVLKNRIKRFQRWGFDTSVLEEAINEDTDIATKVNYERCFWSNIQSARLLNNILQGIRQEFRDDEKLVGIVTKLQAALIKNGLSELEKFKKYIPKLYTLINKKLDDRGVSAEGKVDYEGAKKDMAAIFSTEKAGETGSKAKDGESPAAATSTGTEAAVKEKSTETAGGKKQEDKEEKASDDNVVQCSICSTYNPYDAKKCTGCGAELGEEGYLCAVCNAVIPISQNKCPSCGAEYTDDEEEKEN
ncbi:MAG: hypothetical protein QW728_05385 [Thermoplasmata archaeon]